MITKEQIKEIIQNAMPNAEIHVFGDDGEHFEAIVISAEFEGMMLVKQHQSVMKPLKEAFSERLHALALKTFTPEKWAEVKSNFPV